MHDHRTGLGLANWAKFARNFNRSTSSRIYNRFRRGLGKGIGSIVVIFVELCGD
jgi:hypothetical protein